MNRIEKESMVLCDWYSVSDNLTASTTTQNCQISVVLSFFLAWMILSLKWNSVGKIGALFAFKIICIENEAEPKPYIPLTIR